MIYFCLSFFLFLLPMIFLLIYIFFRLEKIESRQESIETKHEKEHQHLLNNIKFQGDMIKQIFKGEHEK
jgi:hypothetical protein